MRLCINQYQDKTKDRWLIAFFFTFALQELQTDLRKENQDAIYHKLRKLHKDMQKTYNV